MAHEQDAEGEHDFAEMQRQQAVAMRQGQQVAAMEHMGGGGEQEEGEFEGAETGGAPEEGMYDPAEYANLAVSPEINELFQYIGRYKPHAIELETKMRPFIPDYIPAVGDIDSFVKARRDAPSAHTSLAVASHARVRARSPPPPPPPPTPLQTRAAARPPRDSQNGPLPPPLLPPPG
eukprot:5495914-Prymnesium_polylepis.1